MNRGKKPNLSVANRNNQIYMDLKDIIREKALQYLPAKCLRRYTGVCREWKLYISTPFFAHNQSNSFQQVSGLFCQYGASQPSFISLDPNAYGIPDPSLSFLPEKVNIKSSSNGLLCCRGETGARPYYICNPVTRQWKKLPKSDSNHGPDPALVLVFKPSLLNFVAEFKIVCAFQSDLDGCEFDIYSSSDNSWKTSREIFFGDKNIIPNSGVHVDGILYWQTKFRGILAFDLKNERSSLLGGYYSTAGGHFGEYKGKLCCARLSGPLLCIDILANAHSNTMQMNSKAKAWNSKKVGLSNSLFEGRTGAAKLMFVGGEVVVIRFGSMVLSYNWDSKDIEQLSSAAEDYTVMIPYVNSLVEI
ncbi:F-box family protein [Euphorbia peplus]|nr:F-box family protein [Euphorbia peplus]